MRCVWDVGGVCRASELHCVRFRRKRVFVSEFYYSNKRYFSSLLKEMSQETDLDLLCALALASLDLWY